MLANKTASYTPISDASMEEEIPAWITEEKVTVVPKSAETKNLMDYRATTCLPTTYKILTKKISNRIPYRF